MSKQRAKGTAFETDLVKYYRNWWPDCGRNPLAGARDIGDIRGLPLPIEAKNCKTLAIPQWLKEAKAEAENANKPFCPVVYKQRGVTDPSEQNVALKNWMLVELLLAYEAQNT